MTETDIIILAPLFIVGMAGGLWRLHQIKAAVRHARILEADGRKREPSNDERVAIAYDLSHRVGKYFPVLVTVGILLVVVVWLTFELCNLLPADQ